MLSVRLAEWCLLGLHRTNICSSKYTYYNDYIVYSAIIIMSDEKKDAKGKDPMSPEKITSHEPTAVTRDPEDIKEGVAKLEEESKEKLRRSGMTKGTDKA
jgi:hypothetical protein